MSDVISVIGLGYVGLPVAVAFAEANKVIGFDINKDRIAELKACKDSTLEVTEAELESVNIEFTNEISVLAKANFHIVAVPTPIDKSKKPNMGIVHAASMTVGKALKKGDIVVYESTVYPGATEEECVPILEEHSGLKCGVDFFVGYSPERINPGDKEHTFKKIKKVVSAQNEETLEKVAKVYESVVEAGVYKAESIKVAEAAKVIENTQRDLNIAFMNELSIIFNKLDIDTKSVLAAASTKWNFINFYPGLVGGHCIGVDPFYLTHKAEQVGHNPEVILAGRRINDSMGEYIVQKMMELATKNKISLADTEVNLVGLTFKENCPDIRNTRVLDIYKKLKSIGMKVNLTDPMADPNEIEEEFGASSVPLNELKPQNILILAVAHDKVKENFEMQKWLKKGGVLIDVKGLLDRDHALMHAGVYWRL